MNEQTISYLETLVKELTQQERLSIAIGLLEELAAESPQQLTAAIKTWHCLHSHPDEDNPLAICLKQAQPVRPVS